MSTLDEITTEKQRLGEALARVDAQREKLTGQLGELEATERVLTRYSKGTQAKRTPSAKTPTMPTKAADAARPRGRRRTTTAKRRSRKSPLHARGLARTMSASSLPGTSGLAASQSATGSSTPHSRRRRCNAPRSDTGRKKRRPDSERSRPTRLTGIGAVHQMPRFGKVLCGRGSLPVI
jgi:hypothetical protein